MNGMRHRLFVREETAYADTHDTNLSPAFKEYYVYSNIGSRPVKTVNQVLGTTLSRVAKAPTLGRQSVTGGFSFYLPTKNYGVFFKNLFGSSATVGDNTMFFTSPDNASSGLGMVSQFGTDNTFVYDGMFINSATISCGDPNSLVEISLDFIGNDLRKVYWNEGEAGAVSDDYLFKAGGAINLNDVDFTLDETPGNFFPSWNTSITSKNIAGAINHTALTDEFRNLTININNSLGYDGLITDNSNTQYGTGYAAGLMGHIRNEPIPTGQRSVSGSFEIPYSYITDLIEQINETTASQLEITFKATDDTTLVIAMNRVHYNLPDFTALTNDTPTMTINFVATIDCQTTVGDTAGSDAHSRSEIQLTIPTNTAGL